jgi:hypothetical protein
LDVTDYSRSREFHIQALAPLGIELVMDIRRGDGGDGAGFGRNSFPVQDID